MVGATILAAQWDSLEPLLARSFPKVNLLELFGPIGGLLATYAGLLACFLFILFWENRYFSRRATRARLAGR
jgi:uncharacterized membrane protein YedE/YeeE